MVRGELVIQWESSLLIMERRVNDAAKVTSNQASIVTIVLLLKANKYNNYLNLNLLTGIRTTAVPTKVQVGFF